jgi:mannose-6-phosphate isomerase
VELLSNAVRPYAWGSRTTIAELLGEPVPSPHPQAELWMGAHPGDPSRLVGSGTSLLDAVQADPQTHLGQAVVDRFGTRLPFLLKLLAVEEPLSLQAHPSAEQALLGHAIEEKAGVARDAPNRNYPDPTPKPELVCAITEFHVLSGFRDPHTTVRLLRAVQTPGLAAYVDLLAAEPNSAGLRALFTTWITLPSGALGTLLPEVLDACVDVVKEHGEFELECRTVLELGERYPADAGVLASLLLNRVVLAPGESLYLPAGNLHAYLHGTAIEILANSDNVLRGGLTPKYVDVAELLRVLDFGHGDMPLVPGDAFGPVRTFRTPAPEFELCRVDLTGADSAVLPGGSPRIVLCVDGELTLRCDGDELVLRRGRAAWFAAGDGPVRLLADGPACAFGASVGELTAVAAQTRVADAAAGDRAGVAGH